MRISHSPCFGCEERWVRDGKTCHSECERYRKSEELRKLEYEERRRQYVLSDYESERRHKIKRRLNLK